MKGFYEGKLITGPHKGIKVQDAKDIIKKELITSGDAILYSEPESVNYLFIYLFIYYN